MNGEKGTPSKSNNRLRIDVSSLCG